MNRNKKIICIVLCIAMVVTVSGGFNKKISPKHIFAYSENMVNTAQVASDAAIQTEMPVTKTATPGAAEPSETTSGGVIIAPLPPSPIYKCLAGPSLLAEIVDEDRWKEILLQKQWSGGDRL